MKSKLSFLLSSLVAFFLAALVANQVQAELPPVPPHISISTTTAPMIMMNMSRDHQLSYRAYNEYTDVNSDGTPDKTYNHNHRYYGYFDSSYCYTYASGYYSPTAATSGGLCTGTWAGNFLNWATMTRMDILRRILYGGTRSTDTATQTILERQFLPPDAHSFAKYYVEAPTTATTAEKTERPLTSKLTPFTDKEITICNTTIKDANRYSHQNTNPPLLRVAKGDFALWNANERWQCLWKEEQDKGNSNVPAITGLASASDNPVRANVGLTTGGAGPDYNVRVEVCKAGFLPTFAKDASFCKSYPNNQYKPTGLFHEYGETGKAEFGLMTGSWERNITTGVLRRNMEDFAKEIVAATGIYDTAVKGMVFNLNKVRIYGYDYNDGTYNAGDGGCTFGLIGLTEGQCTSWGNPIGGMFVESLRYLAGKTAGITLTAGKQDSQLGLVTETWIDPVTRGSVAANAVIEAKYGKAACRRMDVINMSAAVSSYDRSYITSKFADLNAAAQTATTLTNFVGLKELINGTNRLAGNVSAVRGDYCTNKLVGGLADVSGLCPDAPTYEASYLMAGAAYHARLNAIRATPTSTSPNAFRVTTRSIALNKGSPEIIINAPAGKVIIQPAYLNDQNPKFGGGSLVDFRIVSETAISGRYLVIWEDSEQGGDYDQDAAGIIQWDLRNGKLFVTTLIYAKSTPARQGFGYGISGTNRDGVHFHSGSGKDPGSTPSNYFNFSEPAATPLTVTKVDGFAHPNINASGGCRECNTGQPPSMAEYTIDGTPAATLRDPLWYAARWGGFDIKNGSVTVPPDAGSPADPANYFFAIDPYQLAEQLRAALSSIVAGANTAPSVSSGSIRNGSNVIFTGYEDAGTGTIKARTVTAAGDIVFTDDPIYLAWEGHKKITVPPPGVPRGIFSAKKPAAVNGSDAADPVSGINFTWADLTPDMQLVMNTTPVGAIDALGTKRVDYIRGDTSLDGISFRLRQTAGVANVLGAIVNSSTWAQQQPSLRVPALIDPAYVTFRSTRIDTPSTSGRKRLIWVGANDGMVHGFDAVNGNALVSYVPQRLARKLTSIPDTAPPALKSMVDGSPFTGDVKVTSGWRSYLFGTLGRGGNGVFALDVSDTNTINTTLPNTLVKWEFTDQNDKELGNIISKPYFDSSTGQANQIVKLNNGKFAVIFGNGYNSEEDDVKYGGKIGLGNASLFILGADGPSATGWAKDNTYWRLDTGALGNGPGNGLSGVMPVDIDNNGTVDFIYAGDLKGNLWKFDVSDASPTNWKVAFAGKPLYQATSAGGAAQPITSTPAFIFHPFGGIMVSFGTGKSIQTGDFPSVSTEKQTIYGIWDKPGLTPVGGFNAVIPSRTSFLTPVLTGGATRSLEQIELSSFGGVPGWLVDLPATSEMVLFDPRSFGFDSFLVSTTFSGSGGTDECIKGTSGYLMLIDAFTGGRSFDSFVGTANSVSGIETGGSPITVARNELTNKVTGFDKDSKRVELDPAAKARLFWREVSGVRTCAGSGCK